ncbi:hypothetical protein C427_5577 [Paraglaciecola psychrophila 170]|uniref:DUF3149 domain-containing protein n=1 Tax=Paraglaciecola psychrophila 170 TaxID=1129794 RepID=K6YW06_9ALTE|nr:hypothetical protein C427_5577 [Paraglaciecola psychrophila 170]GAC36889.1 hypothetical protein GPSY_1254 [Paraglaciecola psychrophila 170]
MWDLILHDPVAWGSILGIVVVMGAYYAYLIIHNAKNNI